MELVGSTLEITKSIWTRLAIQIGYIRNIEDNFRKLNEEMQSLVGFRDDVKLEINRDKVEKVPTNDCKAWIEKVDKIEIQMNELTKEYEENKRCLRGWCPNVFSSWKFGKHVTKMINCIEKIGKFKGQVVVNKLRPVVEIIPAQEIEPNTATERTVQKIMDCIRNQRIGRIGVWGMGGIGKTRAMKYLNNQLELNQMFEIVIWVTVSKDWSLRKVQQEIGKRLSLDIKDDESEDDISRRLFHKLEKMKYLLLLDDMWYKIDLDKLGVRCPNKQNGCKIVLTTRSLNVCKKMETGEDVKVEFLSEEEAWKLFHKKAGEVIDSLEIQPLAKDVVKECGGLPLAIIVVGASLRNEGSVPVWRNALRELRSPSMATFQIEEMEEEVFKILKFSYDRLRDDNIKKCFLHAALFPEDFEINKFVLIEYWRGEGFLYDVKTLVEARDKGYAILKSLIDASLFEYARNERIKMHDVIRDLALRISSPLNQEGCRFLVKAGVKLAKPPEEEEWEQAERISLMENDLDSLPEQPQCRALLTLLLRENMMLRSIPKSFFMHLSSLRVLDLSWTNIESLPESICNLVSLRALYLNYTYSVKLPPQVGALRRLQTLHAESCTYLPDEIVNLSRLTSLRVGLQIFDDSYDKDKGQLWILSKLLRLEELILSNPDAGDDLSIEGLVRQVCLLKELTSLVFYFPTMGCLKYFLQNSRSWIDEHLTSFDFYVRESSGHHFHPSPYESQYRSLIYSLGNCIPPEILKVLNHVHYFRLQGHRTVQKLCDFGVENMKGLKHCTVQGCYEMEAFLADGIHALPSLETLHLSDLPMLKSLWKGSGPPKRLVHLKVDDCRNLKTLPSGIHNATTLRRIEGERGWWNALEWEDDAIKKQLQRLFVPDG